MLFILKCGDVSGDSNNVTKEIIIEMNGTATDFYSALSTFAREYGVNILEEFQFDNKIDKNKIEKIYNVLGFRNDIDDVNTQNFYYCILVEEYFEILINIAMFINPKLNIKIKNVETIGFDSCGLTAGW